ncbi:unnamed protein product [Adineta ricciae]|uniref:Uncharacterized protein n=1 Tax=Adineta ricciae TaxID=249248 RepID=A0A816DM73_ADIRI|nr:unnamed protein product [Adineta ricciae]
MGLLKIDNFAMEFYEKIIDLLRDAPIFLRGLVYFGLYIPILMLTCSRKMINIVLEKRRVPIPRSMIPAQFSPIPTSSGSSKFAGNGWNLRLNFRRQGNDTVKVPYGVIISTLTSVIGVQVPTSMFKIRQILTGSPVDHIQCLQILSSFWPLPGHYGTVGSGRLGSFSDHFLAAGIRRAVLDPTQISTDPVAGMIDLGWSVFVRLLLFSSSR